MGKAKKSKWIQISSEWNKNGKKLISEKIALNNIEALYKTQNNVIKLILLIIFFQWYLRLNIKQFRRNMYK